MAMNRVVVIGGGVVGCAVARELSAYDLDVMLLEKEEDICSGTSKANSAIVHAGFDAENGSLKAQFNVEGSERMRDIAADLDVSYRNNGALVLCFSEEDRGHLRELYDRGVANGVKDLEIISGDKARELEPSVSEDVVAALYAGTSAIVCPFELTYAFAENAAANGVRFSFLKEVTGIEKTDDGYVVKTADGESIETEYVVNAAGVRSDEIHNMVGTTKLKINARKGDYLLMDREVGDKVKHTIFQLPGKYGKGVLVTPTVHGNLLAGPTASDVDDRENTATTADELEQVRKTASLSVKDMPFRQVITSFSGLRAHEEGGDFVIGEREDAPGFFDAAGIESPGLSAAPAIGLHIAEKIAESSGAALKTFFVKQRRGIPDVSEMSEEELAELIEEDPSFAQVVCRCETVTEGEIREAIRRRPGATSMDGIKRRVRAGMGRCQAGFCTPRVMEILSEELGIPLEKICKNRPGSELLTSKMNSEEESEPSDPAAEEGAEAEPEVRDA